MIWKAIDERHLNANESRLGTDHRDLRIAQLRIAQSDLRIAHTDLRTDEAVGAVCPSNPYLQQKWFEERNPFPMA